jgi:hypothetical protein
VAHARQHKGPSACPGPNLTDFKPWKGAIFKAWGASPREYRFKAPALKAAAEVRPRWSSAPSNTTVRVKAKLKPWPSYEGAQNKNSPAARSEKDQIRSRLIHERRKIARPMKSYTIQAMNAAVAKSATM